MYIKTNKGWEHQEDDFSVTFTENNTSPNFELVSYFARLVNRDVQTVYYDKKMCVLHPGDIIYLYEYAKNNEDFYFTIGKFIGWSRDIKDLSLDIFGNLHWEVVHVAHFKKVVEGATTTYTITELPIEEYSKYGKETNE